MPRTVIDKLTYALCEQRWASAPQRQRAANAVKLAPNTVLVNHRDRFGTGSYAVRFYATNILTFWADRKVVYFTDGFKTATTMERMNRYGPAQVFKSNGEWFVRDPGRDPVILYDGHVSRTAPPVLPEYLTADVVGLVAALVDTARREGHWSLCPILADALADAGAPDALTDELRGPVPGRAVAALCAAVPAANFAC